MVVEFHDNFLPTGLHQFNLNGVYFGSKYLNQCYHLCITFFPGFILDKNLFTFGSLVLKLSPLLLI